MGRTFVQIQIQDESKKKKNTCVKSIKAKLCPCIKEKVESINDSKWRNTEFPSEFYKPAKPETHDDSKNLMVQLDSNANNIEEVEQTRDED